MPLCSPDCLDRDYDVCIVGAGFAGLATAFGCFERGLDVLVIEAGGRQPTVSGTLGAPNIIHPTHHAPVAQTSCMALGGTSHWWGGRSVRFDPVDFEDREDIGSPGWPISFEDMALWYTEAQAFLGSQPEQSPAPGHFADLSGHDATHTESWGADLNLSSRLRRQLTTKDGPSILLNTKVLGLAIEGSKISGLTLSQPEGQRRVNAAQIILACGGLGVLRLMLNTARTTPGLIAGEALLGHGYMGHLTGCIADLVPSDPDDITGFGCLPVQDGAVTRRQIRPTATALTSEKRANIAFWLDNAPLGDARHGSGAASAKYLLLRQRQIGQRLLSDGLRAGALRGGDTAVLPHLTNILRHPVETIAGLSRTALGRLRQQHLRPDTLRSSGDGGWRLHYHAEQRSLPENQVRLSDAADADGLFGLQIDYRFQDQDFISVLAAHEALDRDLQTSDAGHLRYLTPPERRLDRIAATARDGYHQLGGTRMSEGPETGVVDAKCRVHGLSNLWIASSSVFPSAGQANPTLIIVALARRLAADIAAERSNGGE